MSKPFPDEDPCDPYYDVALLEEILKKGKEGVWEIPNYKLYYYEMETKKHIQHFKSILDEIDDIRAINRRKEEEIEEERRMKFEEQKKQLEEEYKKKLDDYILATAGASQPQPQPQPQMKEEVAGSRQMKEEPKKKREYTRKQKAPAPAPVPAAVPAPAPVPAHVPPVPHVPQVANVSLSINDVIKRLTNQKQIDILERVKRRSMEDQMYFVNFEENTRSNTSQLGLFESVEKQRKSSARERALMGSFTVMGTLNKKGVRESYQVDLYNPDVYDSSKKIFNCDCPAHRFKSSTDDTVCKHISFIMCRVVGYVTADFFRNHRLNKDEVQMIMNKMSAQRDVIMLNIEKNRMKDTCQTIDDKLIIRKVILDRNSYLNSTRPVNEEECPICFDEIEASSGNRLNCPDCKKHIHKECMEIWLSRNSTCVHCRSENWKHYTQCFVQNKSIELRDE